VVFFEIEFPQITAGKVAAVRGNRELHAALLAPMRMVQSDRGGTGAGRRSEATSAEAEQAAPTASPPSATASAQPEAEALPIDEYISEDGIGITLPHYHLISGDLRNWSSEVVPSLLASGFDVSAPTLLLAECVLVYMPPGHSQSIVEWAAGPTGLTGGGKRLSL
jgi:hypothetical protein